MAEAIEKELRIKPDLLQSSGGVFEITSGGNVIFSKVATGRFPTVQEVLDNINQLKK